MADKVKPAAKNKPARAEKPKREVSAKAKPPKPPKKGKQKEPLAREERKKAAWQRKTERSIAARAVAEVGAKAENGLTYDQLEKSGLVTHQSASAKKLAAGPTFEQTLLEVVAAQQLESAEPVSLPADAPDPEVHLGEQQEESFSSVATRRVVAAEICSLLQRTESIFHAYHDSDIPAAQLAAQGLFLKEPGSPLGLRLAEVIIADDSAGAVEEFLEEVYDRIQELQIVSSALDSESELEKSAGLGLIDEATVNRLKKAATAEAIRIDPSQRLAELTASTGAPTEVDETFAALIAESAQAAKAERKRRATFRQTLRERKGREGRRFSKPSEKSEDEEFLLFLSAHRGERSVEQELLAREIAAATEAANRSWTELKIRLAAGTDNPEIIVAHNAAAMKNILGDLAQIRALRVQLEELD